MNTQIHKLILTFLVLDISHQIAVYFKLGFAYIFVILSTANLVLELAVLHIFILTVCRLNILHIRILRSQDLQSIADLHNKLQIIVWMHNGSAILFSLQQAGS